MMFLYDTQVIRRDCLWPKPFGFLDPGSGYPSLCPAALLTEGIKILVPLYSTGTTDICWGTLPQRSYTLYFKGASCTLSGLDQPSPAALPSQYSRSLHLNR